jgi:LDH2 family malate/lactate/ureidoglycolate dehydrogenase
MEEQNRRFPCAEMKAFVKALFKKLGVSGNDAALAAEVHVGQEMRGIKTHGLRRVPPNLKLLQHGRMNPAPVHALLRDKGAVAVVDGDNGLGALAAMTAMRLAVSKARDLGIGMVTVVNSQHFVSAAPYCLEAAAQGMLGICCSNTQSSMGYPGAVGDVLGNNPLGFAVPGKEFPICYDGAMAFSYGRLNQYRREGKQLPEGFYGIDDKGNVTRDPEVIHERGFLMPIGDHKGAALGILVELLTGVIGGGAFLSGIVPPDKRTDKAEGDSQCCIAVDIEHFMPLEKFHARITDFVADIKGRPKAKDVDEITLPGERMHRRYLESMQHGISVDPDVGEAVNKWARELSVSSPLEERI